MDDKFLYDARREPRPEFAGQLRTRLAETEDTAEDHGPGPVRAWAIAAAVLAVIGLTFTLPSVRASAQAFLELFRVRNFAAVPVDPARIQRLQSASVNLDHLIGDHVEKVHDPGPMQVVADPSAAASLAGMPVAVPRELPRGLALDSVRVRGLAEARVTVALAPLRNLLTTLAIDDVTLPQNLDGSKVMLRMPPAVLLGYRGDKARATLIQSRSPELGLPAGLDLPELGEIGLRIMGLSKTEAHRFAQTIDWHSTMLVPMSASAASFDQVDVHGQHGLLITFAGNAPENHERAHDRSMLLWSEGDKVYALTGNIGRVDLTQMANSVR